MSRYVYKLLELLTTLNLLDLLASELFFYNENLIGLCYLAIAYI